MYVLVWHFLKQSETIEDHQKVCCLRQLQTEATEKLTDSLDIMACPSVRWVTYARDQVPQSTHKCGDSKKPVQIYTMLTSTSLET